jgi:2'-5' RNA ligase
VTNWFIGLPFEAGAWLDALPPHPAGVRRLAEADLHLTVAFLGDVPEDAARAAWAATTWADGPIDVTLTRVVTMGPPRRWSALSALLVRGRESVEASITASRPAAYTAAGARPDDRTAKAHLTIARPKRSATNDERSAALAWAEGLALPRDVFVLDRIALYTWAEDRASSLYRIVEEAELPKRTA